MGYLQFKHENLRMLKNIAILLTCFNRKEKTLSALEHLYLAKESQPDIKMTIYLTDDGSTDGTSEVIKNRFPKVKVLQGTGSLFWAGGMRKSWSAALKNDYDAFLLLNDDTNVFVNLFNQLVLTHKECERTYKQSGVYIGSTKDQESDLFTYGGAIFENRYNFKYKFLHPNGNLQTCELGNANIMLVTKEVVDEIGILSKGYRHGVADYDYTLRASKKKIPVLVAPEYCGTCSHDHGDVYESFSKKPFKERFRMLKHPLGLDFNSNLLLMRRHFPIRVPFVALAAGLKLFFPNVYVKARGKNQH